MDEFGLIKRYFAPLAGDAADLHTFGLEDDAASFGCEGGDLVLTTDMLVAGVHFLADDPAETIARKALAVNVSDLVAKGARPVAYLLSLALPSSVGEDWVAAFAEGLRIAGETFGCRLAGGDTTATGGPLVVNIAVIGKAGEGGMVRRGSAQAGDAVYATGPIGDAAFGLLLHQADEDMANVALSSYEQIYLVDRYLLPRPRVELIGLVAEFASAAMDVSDGLVGDFAKMCTASGVAGVIHAPDIPLSPAAASIVEQRPAWLKRALTGGDDYVVLMCVRPDRIADFETTAAGLSGICRIGSIEAGEGVRVLDAVGAAMSFATMSYNHFAK